MSEDAKDWAAGSLVGVAIGLVILYAIYRIFRG